MESEAEAPHPPPQAPSPSKWPSGRVGATSSHRPFKGTTLGQGRRKQKIEGHRGPGSSRLLQGRGPRGAPKGEGHFLHLSAAGPPASPGEGPGPRGAVLMGDERAEAGTLCGCRWAQSWRRWKTPSLHSMIQCSSMGASCTLEAAIAMPKPTSRTRPPGQRSHITCQAGAGELPGGGGPRPGSCGEKRLPQGREGTSGAEVEAETEHTSPKSEPRGLGPEAREGGRPGKRGQWILGPAPVGRSDPGLWSLVVLIS